MQAFFANIVLSDVPSHFVPQGNTHYRIVAAKETSKALTVVGGTHNLTISTFKNDASQRFTIIPQGNKYAFVVQSTSTALCIYYDNKQNCAEVRADPGKHDSSWFEIKRAENGTLSKKGYLIETFAHGKCLDIEAGVTNDGTKVLQFDIHNGDNQVWVIVPADQQLHHQNQNNQNNWSNNQNQWGNQSNQGQWGQSSGQGQWGQSSGHGHHGHHGHHDHKSNQGFMIEMEGAFKKNYTYAIISCGNDSKCIHINHDNHAKIYDFQGTNQQKFILEFEKEKNKYRIKSIANGQYLSGAGLFSGGAITTKPKCEMGELWTLEPSNNAAYLSKGPAYYIRSFTGHAIDVPGENYSNGVQLQKHGFHSAPNQTWYIVER